MRGVICVLVAVAAVACPRSTGAAALSREQETPFRLMTAQTVSECTEVSEVNARLSTALDDSHAEIEKLSTALEESRTEQLKRPLLWRRTTMTPNHAEVDAAQLERPLLWRGATMTPSNRADDGDRNRRLSALHHRKALATFAPTPLLSPVPSSTPSASPVPTTTGITTHAQLTNAVANLDNSEVVIEAPLTFPTHAPITIGASRSVSMVGSADDGGRVTLDGFGRSRLFLVIDGGALTLTNLDLINATVPGDVTTDCIGSFSECWGAAILVMDGGSLVVWSCDFRGGGPGVSEFYGNAFAGSGVAVVGCCGSAAEFHDAKFTKLRAQHGAAVASWYCTQDAPCLTNFFGCEFVECEIANEFTAGVVTIGVDYSIESTLDPEGYFFTGS